MYISDVASVYISDCVLQLHSKVKSTSLTKIIMSGIYMNNAKNVWIRNTKF